MPILYNISFTTKTLVKKFDEKGNIIGTELANPITIKALPRSTALAYSKCANFKMERYQPQNTGNSSRGIGNATKKVDWSKHEQKPKTTKTKVSKRLSKTKAERAAETGDMGAAINA